MAKRQSAGILAYRWVNNELQFLLVHPGGPFWVGKDAGAWTIPKGEFTEPETPLEAASREFAEETGTHLQEPFLPLTPVIQKAGKTVHAWAKETVLDADAIQCNTFKVQWPPGSGQWKTYPEVDKAAWLNAADAKQKINPAQVAFIDELIALLQQKV